MFAYVLKDSLKIAYVLKVWGHPPTPGGGSTREYAQNFPKPGNP